MPNALLLGKPFHGEVHAAPGAPETLELEAYESKEQRTPTGYGGIGMPPKRELKLIYHRQQLNACPPDALVYVREGYEPQPEDEELVRQTFGDSMEARYREQQQRMRCHGCGEGGEVF